jgi:uncharacterized protein (TIGR02677 family)
VDRAADFRTLARWLAACESERDAHRLWQSASGLYAARHFYLAEDDAELAAPSTSWWHAAPVEVPVRLRTRGQISNAGRAAPAADHTQSKQWIAQHRRRERAQIDAAIRRFAGRGTLRLSDVAELDTAEFDLLLALLDEALGTRRREDGARTTRTRDGRLLVTLYPPGERDARVTLSTPRGRLRCMDYRIEVSDTTASAAVSDPRPGRVQRTRGG